MITYSSSMQSFTPRLFELGKGLAVKRIKSDFQFSQQAHVFNQVAQENNYTLVAGERTLVSLSGAAKEEALDVMAYRRFCYTISKGTSPVEQRTLPPTSATALYHVQHSSVLSCNVRERKMLHYEARRMGWHIVD